MTISPVSGLQAATKIVSPTAGQGNYTTIQAAITAASSGETILIKPGTYTENLTLKAGVNLAAFGTDGLSSAGGSGTVIINGKCTFTAAGTVRMSGLMLQTNSDFALAVTGSAASVVLLQNCNINCTNNTGISFTTSSSSATIVFYECIGDLGTTGIAVFANSSAGTINFRYTKFTNSGNSTTANTSSAGNLFLWDSELQNPTTTSGNSGLVVDISSFNTAAINSTSLTQNSTVGGSVNHTNFNSGTASAISIGGSASLTLLGSCVVNSSNATAIAGTGTLNYGVIDFQTNSGIASGLTLSFIQPFKQVIQTFTGSGSYTPTKGMYQCIIECVGGGGAGGGSGNTGAAVFCAGGGGGGGGYARKLSTAATIGSSQTVTIGAAGTPGAAGNVAGGNGGDTSVGAICIGKGGTGGGGGSGTVSGNGGAGGVAGTGDFTFAGENGTCSPTSGNTAVIAGVTARGGNSYFGTGGAATNVVANTAGNAGVIYGGGGSGGASLAAGGTTAGAAGAAGLVVITEFVLT